jgi:DNA mismatch repair protein MutS2
MEANTLDLRGKRYEEALQEASIYLDQSFRLGALSARIITGHGTGAIKKGVRDLVESLPYVKGFRPDRQGDDGCIVVEFEGLP